MTKLERLKKQIEAAKEAEAKQKAIAMERKKHERELAALEREEAKKREQEAAKKFRGVFKKLISDDEILEKPDEEILKFLIQKLTTTTQSGGQS